MIDVVGNIVSAAKVLIGISKDLKGASKTALKMLRLILKYWLRIFIFLKT